jgi:hypothetical protein
VTTTESLLGYGGRPRLSSNVASIWEITDWLSLVLGSWENPNYLLVLLGYWRNPDYFRLLQGYGKKSKLSLPSNFKDNVSNHNEQQEEVLGRTNRLLSLDTARTPQKMTTPTIRLCRGNVFNELLPSNKRGIHRQTHRLSLDKRRTS